MKLIEINEIAKKAGIPIEFVEPYGHYKAKISPEYFESIKDRKNGKLVLVTAITPTKAGEGKTTTSIALAEGLARIHQKAMLCLREPSLGPVFGIKGGATGGGKVTIEPSEDINLHFTGDMHALTSSINLISAVIDNHIYQGNELGIDPSHIVWKRAMDMNDRALRNIMVSEHDSKASPREDGFVITVASEMMAILCLARDEDDFLSRLERIIVAYSYEGKPITVKDLKITHAVMKLMKEALKVNLVQTGEGNPCFIHGGPFANIAHGCNSLLATKTALKMAPIVITEAGFGADLGAEKFLDIVCQEGNLHPDAVVMVATIRALKMHGGAEADQLEKEDVASLEKGICNLKKHLENIQSFGLPVIVAINHFASDSPKEVETLKRWCKEHGYEVSFQDGFISGGEGAVDLASLLVKTLDGQTSNYHPIYDRKMAVKEKIDILAKKIYGAKDVEYSPTALEQIASYEKMGFASNYICMAKTPASLSDDPKLVGTPEDFSLHIREVGLSAGAEFLVPLTGSILTMPGLPKLPAAVKMEEKPW